MHLYWLPYSRFIRLSYFCHFGFISRLAWRIDHAGHSATSASFMHGYPINSSTYYHWNRAVRDTAKQQHQLIQHHAYVYPDIASRTKFYLPVNERNIHNCSLCPAYHSHPKAVEQGGLHVRLFRYQLLICRRHLLRFRLSWPSDGASCAVLDGCNLTLFLVPCIGGLLRLVLGIVYV
jgi:hypothetical protein